MDCKAIEPLRARRRRITETVARRRHSSFIRKLLGKDPSTSRRASTSPYYWASMTVGSCGCTKRHHGAPRRDKGLCCIGARDRIYQWRAEARALKQGCYEEE